MQDRLADRTVSAQKERDQQTSKPSVSVQKRVNGFELHVRQACLDQHRHLRAVAVKKKFKTAHASRNEFRRRDEDGVPPDEFRQSSFAPSFAGPFYQRRPERSIAWISQRSRSDSGKPPRSRAKP